jgi:Ser-tRNA(Ala) deacylase AlaX
MKCRKRKRNIIIETASAMAALIIGVMQSAASSAWRKWQSLNIESVMKSACGGRNLEKISCNKEIKKTENQRNKAEKQ